MAMENSNRLQDLTVLAGEIVAAYVSHNPVPIAELPNLINSIHNAIFELASGNGSPVSAPAVEVEKMSATRIRKSVRDDGIISFIDGKSYKTLRRHLTANGMNPESYRERYGLPADYPLVASNYAEKRSALAKAIGLGVPGGRVARFKADAGR